MRISDWSSDVCSSDLGQAQGQQAGADQDGHLGHLGEQPPALVEEEEHTGGQRQGTEERSNAHAQRQLPRLVVLVYVEGGAIDRKSVVLGKSVAVSVDMGGRRIIRQNNDKKLNE